MEASAWIAFGALIFTILTVSGGGLAALFNRLESNKTAYIKLLGETKRVADEQLSSVRKDLDRSMDLVRRDMEAAERRNAEPVFAMREKIAGVELYLRDNYVSKREYERDYAQLLLALKAMQEALEKRLDVYEERVEKLIIPQGRLPLA